MTFFHVRLALAVRRLGVPGGPPQAPSLILYLIIHLTGSSISKQVREEVLPRGPIDSLFLLKANVTMLVVVVISKGSYPFIRPARFVAAHETLSHSDKSLRFSCF
jgi:hypothetical protein